MNLSEHFTLEELTRSATADKWGVDNTPPADALAELRRLCVELLEPARTLLGVPFQVNSGFRAPRLNVLVGGQPTSAHLDGRAGDVVPQGLDLTAAWARLKMSPLPYDQLIIETAPGGARWLHLAIARDGEVPRRQAFPLTKRFERRALG